MSLARIAYETLAMIEAGSYVAPSGSVVRFADAQAAAVEGTRLYTPDELAALAPRGGDRRPSITVSDETTQEAAHRLVALEGRGEVAVLNFASARNHGGGFLGGAKAQEEDLCRCSGLYPALLAPRVQAYYRENRAQRSALYTDHAIYSPRVPWFRVRGRGELLEAPFLASVVTAPAPNASALSSDAAPAIREAFRRRWGYVLRIAAANDERTLVLGAWGCGAFRNDPEVAAETLAEALAGEGGATAIERVVLAIPNRGAIGEQNHAAFARRFG